MSIDPNNLAATAHETFDDEFNNLSLWNGSSGTWSTSFWYQNPTGNGATLANNGEQEWYINSQYAPTAGIQPWTVSNGVLTLTASTTPSNLASQVNNYSYVSGEVNTYHSFAQTYGYFEMRAELPAGQGLWPAFWLMPENGSWPPELDAMEVLGSNPSGLVTTVHSDATGSPTQVGNWTQIPDSSAGYHTYGVDWEPDYITWYFDGKQVFQTPTPADMNQPMYMIANLAVGGYWPGPASGWSSAQMNIDYIRAYAPGAAPGSGGSGSGGSPPPPAGAVSVSDASYTAPSGVTAITLTGSGPQTIVGNNAGDTITSDNYGNRLTGGTGNDTFIIGRGGDTVTGGGGTDTFVFNEVPWATGHITDFIGQDVIDLSGMFARYGYTGSNPITDGRLTFVDDGQGDAQIWFRTDGLPNAGPGDWLLTTLDNQSASNLSYQNDQITVRTTDSSANPPPTTGSSVSVSDASYTAPSDVTGITLTGWGPQTIVGNNAGDTITSDNYGNHLTGGTGNDTFVIGRGGDTVTGGGGADRFVFNEVPWAVGHITDFTASDTIDLSGMYSRYGYTGSNPIADGHMTLVSDGSGGTQIWFDTDGLPNAGPGDWLVTTLDGVSASSLQVSNGQITEASGSTSPGTGSGSGSVSSTPVYISDASYTAPAGVTNIVLSGWEQTIYANNSGDTITSDNNANHIYGGTGNDTIIIGRGGDTITGGGGSDSFVFNEVPWAGSQITDFSSQDTLDLSGMYSRYGYTGSDPVADGRLKLVADGQGDTQVWFTTDGLPNAGAGTWLVTTLDHIDPSAVHVNGGWLTL